ncbi:hypothetical protein Tco_1266218 [Tanacetum coccineum]
MRNVTSATSYPGPRAIPNLFRGGKVTFGLSSLRLAEGSSNCGDEVGTDMGKGGGIPNDGASGLVGESMKGGGNGREWEVDAASALIQIIALLDSTFMNE